jgi:ElaB/YqjD/DUF883 family membrane-anchored ribosome-binding protein
MAQAKKETTQSTKQTDNSKHPIADKVKDTLHDSVDTLSEKAAATEQSLRESAQSGSENLAQKQAEMQAKWDQSSVRRYASENPVAAAGIAFAAGALLTAFLKRK